MGSRVIPTIVGLDLGTVYLGLVVARDSLPLYVLAADTWRINKDDLGPVADRMRAELDALADPGGLPPRLVMEIGTLYIPVGSDEKKSWAMATAHARAERLRDLIFAACPGPWYHTDTIPRRTWSSRVKPHHKGGVSDEEANEALVKHLDAYGAWTSLSDQHRRDACGAVLGDIIGSHGERVTSSRAPGVKGKRNRKRVPYVYKEPPHLTKRRAEDARLDALCEEGALRILAAPPRVVMEPSAPPRPCACGSRGPHRAACKRTSSHP